jgi:hypothetical protein
VFGSLKYEHLYRYVISDGQTLAVGAKKYRHIFNAIRPHEALDMKRPKKIYQQDQRAQRENQKLSHKLDAGQCSGVPHLCPVVVGGVCDAGVRSVRFLVGLVGVLR